MILAHYNEFSLSFFLDPVQLLSGPLDQTVNFGDIVTMSCLFQSLLDVQVIWYFGNGVLSNETNNVEIITTGNFSTLTLQAELTNSGNYSCQISNNILDSVSGTGELIVGEL